MEVLFTKILNMSIQATILIAAVIVLRLLLKRAPKWSRCILWGLVAIRLICPFSIESSLSLAPDSQTVSTNIQEVAYDTQPNNLSIDEPVKEKVADSGNAGVAASIENKINYISILSKIWLLGIFILAIYSIVSYRRVRLCVRESIKLRGNIYVCDRIDTPFILGIRKPVIYLPSSISKKQRVNVIAHEKAHLKRYDYIWKPLGFGILILHCFNPFCWLAYILFSKDIELACDEKVIKNMNLEQKKTYSRVLLSMSSHKTLALACPLAFGEVGVKERIKNILSYKKPTVAIIVLAGIACVVISVCFLTSPKSKHENTNSDINAEDKVEDLPIEDKNSVETEDLTTEEINSIELADIINQEKEVISAFTLAYLNKDMETVNLYLKDGVNISFADIGVDNPNIISIEGLTLQEGMQLQENMIENAVVSFKPSSTADSYMRLDVGIEYIKGQWKIISCNWSDTGTYPISASETTTGEIALEDEKTSEEQRMEQTADSYAGTWKINGEMTQNNLKNYASIYDVYGTGLRDYGGEIQLAENGEFSMFMGIGYSATGNYQITDGSITAEVSLSTGDSVENTTMTFNIITIDGVTYLTTDIYDETVYWSK